METTIPESPVRIERNDITLVPFPSVPHLSVTLRGTGQNARNLTDDFRNLASFARGRNVSAVFAPRLGKAGGYLARREEFSFALMRDMCVRDGIRSEGVNISPGEAICFATGDCPTVIMYTPERPGMVVAAHAGRDPILKGVIANMVSRFGNLKHRSRIMVFITLGIGPDNFDHDINHPQWGAKNRDLISRLWRWHGDECVTDRVRGTIDLRALITKRCAQFEIPAANVIHDGHDTYLDVLPDGTPAWHSHRAGSTERNLVFVQFDKA